MLAKAKMRRQVRTRSKISGTAARPRLSVAITNKHVIAQLIDDESAKTLGYSTSAGQKLPAALTERAIWVGTDIAKQALSAKIKQVVFDRGARRYHGRVKSLAEAARTGGLEF